MRLGVPLSEPAAEPAAPAARSGAESLPDRLTIHKRTLARARRWPRPAPGLLLWPLLAALLTFVVWQPFVRLDFDLWKADDGEYHLLRVYVFEWAVRAGERLPRWTPDLFVGLGY